MRWVNTVWKIVVTLLLLILLAENTRLHHNLTIIQKDSQDFQKECSLMLEQGNTTKWVIMDTCMRIFHYVKPHKGSVLTCPECGELYEKHRKEELKQKQLNKEVG